MKKRKEGYNVNDETIRLTAIMLSTFMISSNRKLRDMTTKALVILLSGHINILIKVMKTFEAIDDPYVTERLYAVAFGYITNATALSEIEELAIYVFLVIFILTKVVKLFLTQNNLTFKSGYFIHGISILFICKNLFQIDVTSAFR